MKKLLCILILLINVVVHAGADESCSPSVIYKDRIVEKEKPVYFHSETVKKVDITRKNRLSLLLLNGPSNDVSVNTNTTGTTIRHKDKNAAGLQYMRDLGRFNLLIQGDSNKSVGLGLGVNW